jgi:hypothetical protein
MSESFSKKTKKRIEGAVGLGKLLAEENPIVHAVATVKEIADSTHKLVYGKDINYIPKSSIPKRPRALPKRYSSTPRRQVIIIQRRRVAVPRWRVVLTEEDEALVRLLERDPLRGAKREARRRGDYAAMRAVDRLSA